MCIDNAWVQLKKEEQDEKKRAKHKKRRERKKANKVVLVAPDVMVRWGQCFLSIAAEALLAGGYIGADEDGEFFVPHQNFGVVNEIY